MRLLLFIALFMFSFLQARAQLRFARIFGHQMVLQREQPLPVWGWAKPGEQVTVQLDQDRQTATCDANGKWMVKLPARDAGGPYTLSAQSGKDRVELRDLWIGEVWLCSGQSNMEWEVRWSNQPGYERRHATDSLIRHLKIQTNVSLTPLDELPVPRTPWEVCSPKTVPQFSAVAYFFAQTLREKLGPDIAIGLINSTWGGSHAEAWISQEGLAAHDLFQSYAGRYPGDWTAANELLKKKVLHYCLGDRPMPDSATERTYARPDFDFSQWPAAEAPGAWDWQGVWAFRGKGFMAKKIIVPDWLAGEPAVVRLGEQSEPVQCWINGQAIPLTADNRLVSGQIPAGLLRKGDNPLMVQIAPQSGPNHWGLGLFGDAQTLRLEWGDYSMALTGDDWHKMPAWNQPYRFETLQNNVASGLYNAMIHPLAPLAFNGVIWYQGESNAERAHEYQTTFPLLIQDWRRVWDREFPFLFVQLSAFGKNNNSNTGSKWAELREAQTKALELPNTGMAVTIDIGDADDIHPRNKQDVGRRLGLIALSKVYGQDVPSEGPQLRQIVWEAAGAVLTFDQVGAGLMAKDKFGYVRGFEIAGADQQFYFAQAQIWNDRQIVVYHPKGEKPVAVRYAWSDAPMDANVFNSHGLPLGPFRTDTWKGLTEGVRFAPESK